MSDKTVPAILVTLLALVILAAMFWGWRARKRRQTAFGAPTPAPTTDARGELIADAPVLYVATTRAGEPLDRLTIPGLAFRGRATAGMYRGGFSIVIPGEPETFVATDRIRSIGTSTWAIDRAVETGGLVRLDWTYDSATGPVDVESYLRATGLGDARRLIDAVETIIPAPAPPDRTPQQEGPSS